METEEVRARVRDVLVALLKELRGWEGRRYGRKPLIIELHR